MGNLAVNIVWYILHSAHCIVYIVYGIHYILHSVQYAVCWVYTYVKVTKHFYIFSNIVITRAIRGSKTTKFSANIPNPDTKDILLRGWMLYWRAYAGSETAPRRSCSGDIPYHHTQQSLCSSFPPIMLQCLYLIATQVAVTWGRNDSLLVESHCYVVQLLTLIGWESYSRDVV